MTEQYDQNWFEVAYDRLEALRSMPAGWDGYGASRISSRAINLAHAVIRELPLDQLWTVCPGSDGSITIERHQDGVDEEITIYSTVSGSGVPTP